MNTQRPPRSHAHAGIYVWWFNLAVVLGLFASNLYSSEMGFAGLAHPSQLLQTLGRLTGLLAMFFMLVEVVLVARVKPLESTFGQDRLTRWHRWNGHLSLYTLLAHVVLIVFGYEVGPTATWWSTFVDMVLNFRDVMMATVATVLIIGVVLTSIQIARKKLRYETWHYVHLYTYLAIALSFSHQIYIGTDFANHPAAQIYWGALYAMVMGAVLYFRISKPLANYARHQFKVQRVVRESTDAVSVYIVGRNLAAMNIQPGQFFLWRFLIKQYWYQAHPYSISAAPNGNEVRITVKNLGDSSGDVAYLKPGTRVIAEGPYGIFTPARMTRDGAVLVAGGAGVGPICSVLEGLHAFANNKLDVVYRSSDQEKPMLFDEIKRLTLERGGRLHAVGGKRTSYPQNRQPLTAEHFQMLIPDITTRDVFVCGPDGMTKQVVASLRQLKLQANQIHYESFSF